MPRLIIDDREIDVAPGTKVIEAAEQLGIMIPRFCYHPALGSVGACRVCAVKFLQGPFKGVQMSCMIEAKDGMVVSTTDEEAVDFRRHVIEWLMLNHPHDCPVCDEGGHCLLQDMTIAGGHGIRRYGGKKRTYKDQDLGPLVQHEMNRCIHCYRCSRFYQEFTGYRDLGVMRLGSRLYFGRHKDGTLESPFAGNLTEICPTGVYTDKPSRFVGRRWDYERTPSVCIHCSLGCQTIASVRYRRVVRTEARYSEAVNGHFICDRGRHGSAYASHPERPRVARIANEEVSLDRALGEARDRIEQAIREGGPRSVACVGSARNDLRTQAALKQLCASRGLRQPAFFLDSASASKTATAISRLESDLVLSLRELEQADCILAVGVDPVNEAPMLAMAMRQAVRAGGEATVIDPRPVTLPFSFHHIPARVDALDACLGAWLKEAVDPAAMKAMGEGAARFFDAIPALEGRASPYKEELAASAARARGSVKTVIVCGTDIVRESTPEIAADCASLLRGMEHDAGLFFVIPGANAVGPVLLSVTEESLEQVLEAIEAGEVRTLILVEDDPFLRVRNRARLEKALRRLERLIVLDHVDSETVKGADIFIPTATLFERGGVFINQECRLQAASVAYRGGVPVSQESGGSHPPRVFREQIPGADPVAAWEVLERLAGGEETAAGGSGDEESSDWLIRACPDVGSIPSLDGLPDDGVRIRVQGQGRSRFREELWSGEDTAEEGLELVLTDLTFGSEELSLYSAPLREVEESPRLFIHVSEAARLGLQSGDRAALSMEGGVLEADVCVTDRMAEGTLVLPRHRRLDWQKLGSGRVIVSPSLIKQVV